MTDNQLKVKMRQFCFIDIMDFYLQLHKNLREASQTIAA